MISNLRILLVEDSPDILFIMKTELEWLGHSVMAAADANAALDIVTDTRPDVIISDIQMPGLDGLEFIRRIRSNPDLAAIPAIALSGFGMEKNIQESLAHGFSAHCTKPVEPSDLDSLIRQLVSEPRRRLAGA
jgi:two-component system CheB/CheR fusion protein